MPFSSLRQAPPYAVGFGGLLYIFGLMLLQDEANILGVICDAKNNDRSKILKDTCNCFSKNIKPTSVWSFAASLGESQGKILVADPFAGQLGLPPYQFVYDVTKGECYPSKHSGPLNFYEYSVGMETGNQLN